MSGIVGIEDSKRRAQVEQMLDRIEHRGRAGREIIEADGGTLGVVWTETHSDSIHTVKQGDTVRDNSGNGHFSQAQVVNGHLMLIRDQLGVVPLYYGRTDDAVLCFASEVKALLEVTQHVRRFPPGYRYCRNRFEPYFSLARKQSISKHPGLISKELHRRLASSVEKRIKGDVAGAWLSGGLDSSTLAALARPHVEEFHTFVAGLPDAPDIEHAREMAAFIESEHHEIIVTLSDLLSILSDVIYYLESFDALLVRSSITNYLVGEAASEYVHTVFSGEGGDELFAGYEYLKFLDSRYLEDELLDITGRLHNTALQRVDRSASAHSIIAHVGFLDPQVVNYALRIPAKYKLHNGVGKWILRRAMKDVLPKKIVERKKVKFWEGAGVGDLLSHYADSCITDKEFGRERTLPNGWVLNTKEELMYYRIFREHFGELKDLTWMGRTKNAPRQ